MTTAFLRYTLSTLRFVALAGALISTAYGRTFYVSSRGDDRNSGLTETTAWHSLKRVNLAPLRPGDRVLFRRGDSWSEQLVPASSGTADLPITFDAYGVGPSPVLDGTAVPLPFGEGLVNVYFRSHIIIASLDVHSSLSDGVVAYCSNGFAAKNMTILNSQRSGIVVNTSSDILIAGNDVSHSNLSGSAAYSGIVVDSSKGGVVRNIRILSNRIHDNLGSAVNNANGIKLGHTGDYPATVHDLRIENNEISKNGYPSQNQFGRGITSSIDGEIIIEHNYIHDNASAGAFIGDHNNRFSLTYRHNVFKNNHLRGFGWIGNGPVVAQENVVLCTMRGLACIGTELNGKGMMVVSGNLYYLRPHPRYGAFVIIQNGSDIPHLSSNIYCDTLEGPGSPKYLIGDFSKSTNYLTFHSWSMITGDISSREESPRQAAKSLQRFEKRERIPAEWLIDVSSSVQGDFRRPDLGSQTTQPQ